MNKKIDLLKKVTYLSLYYGGDMPYPPLIGWSEKIKLTEIKKGWRNLAAEISSGEQKKDKVGVYLHIPFCVSKCFYCNCISFASTNSGEYDKYLDCLDKEIRLIDFPADIKIKTFYIGGGTPSILDVKQIDRLASIVRSSFDLSYCEQIMTEISPYTVSPEKMRALKNFGVNKVTIGVQTLDEKLLKKLKRPQEKKLVLSVFRQAREIGIKYINIDIMAGLPYQTEASFISTLNEILKLRPDTIHTNPFFPTSFTSFSLSGRHLSRADIKKRAGMLKLGYSIIRKKCPQILERAGLEKENLQIYNSANFNSSLLGLGWGAISHVRSFLHYAKDREYRKYLEKLEKGLPPQFFGYRLNIEEEMRANIIKSLQQRGEFKIDNFKNLFGIDPLVVFKKEICELEKVKKLK